MPPLRSLALLFCVLTLACMAATLVVIPAVCMVFKPKFLEPVSLRGISTGTTQEARHE
jgi:hypothetical protein